ncbi:hypothetical protein ABZ638_12805 [Streptomyces sp. NPDC007107]|uniref:hypothetical protein n=1 Tax=Streptomyces sp. NPDC007107 TaxID=3156915 RepID=UPI0033C2E4BD
MRKATVGLAMVFLLMAGAVGCGEDEKSRAEEAWEQSVVPERLCGGAAVSARAGKALELITGSSRFEASGPTSTVAAAAKDLSDQFTSSVTGHGDVCRVYTPVGVPDLVRPEITWRLSGSAPAGGPGSRYTELEMGELAGTAPDRAFVTFACRSEELPGLAPAHVDIHIDSGVVPKEPEGDVEALKDAYATVAHSFALAMAKEMSCDHDGGLEAQPSLDPA